MRFETWERFLLIMQPSTLYSLGNDVLEDFYRNTSKYYNCHNLSTSSKKSPRSNTKLTCCTYGLTYGYLIPIACVLNTEDDDTQTERFKKECIFTVCLQCQYTYHSIPGKTFQQLLFHKIIYETLRVLGTYLAFWNLWTYENVKCNIIAFLRSIFFILSTYIMSWVWADDGTIWNFVVTI